MNSKMETGGAGGLAQRLRQRFWSRLRGLRLVRESELIRVHRHAQVTGMAPEASIVALGLLSEEQVFEILTGERPVAAALAS